MRWSQVLWMVAMMTLGGMSLGWAALVSSNSSSSDTEENDSAFKSKFTTMSFHRPKIGKEETQEEEEPKEQQFTKMNFHKPSFSSSSKEKSDSSESSDSSSGSFGNFSGLSKPKSIGGDMNISQGLTVSKKGFKFGTMKSSSSQSTS